MGARSCNICHSLSTATSTSPTLWQMTEFCFLFLSYRFFFLSLFFKASSHSVSQAGLELTVTLLLSILDCRGSSTPPNFLFSQVTLKVYCACAHIFFTLSPTSSRHLDWLCSLVFVNNPILLLISILPETNTAVKLQDRKIVRFAVFLFVVFCFESASSCFL